MDTTTLYQIFLQCAGVTTDSRHCSVGTLFFALKGGNFDGNKFAVSALQQGAAYAVIDAAEYAVAGDKRYILVDDCLRSLQALARHHRLQWGRKVIGITGTNGKTTTKELISVVLSKKYNVLYTMGNLNNQIGVPLTLLRLRSEHEIAVVEMGASHPGDIKELCDICVPNCGIITNVGRAHLEGFGSFEGVKRTKAELFSAITSCKDGLIFVDADSTDLMEMAKGVRQIRYGRQAEDERLVTGSIADSSRYLTMEWEERGSGKKNRIETQLIGKYNFTNVLAAVTIGRYFGVDAEDVNAAIAGYVPTNNRSQLKETPYNTLIIDAYNANPTSMMAALDDFRTRCASHKMLILGDMKELGAESAAEHQKMVDYIARYDEVVECVVLVGALFGATKHPLNFETFADVQQLIEAFRCAKPTGKTILIKGSNSMKLSLLAEEL
jgi:UDP-N-acetylmuramoyl-tripeptide--D-alanyl-D-alanine ligase